jgi:mycobactin peptide synthetase MbtE
VNRPDRETLHGIVAGVTAATPDAVAVIHGERTVTYRGLDRAAAACAAGLSAAGVRPGDLVPVLLPRGAELVAVILGVLRLGAAYALLDQDWPDRRIAEATEELGAALVVAPATAADRLALPVWSPGGGLFNSPSPTAPRPSGAVPADVTGTSPACVFFTSGTTGRPKGVLSPHRATARLFRPGTFARFGPGTVVPLAAAQPWDGFALELWSALLTGGTSLVVEEPYLSAQALRDGIADHGVNTAWLTSSLFNMIVDEDPAAFAGLRQLMIGGERLSAPHVRAFLDRHPGVALINGYGPVESTVFATTHRITAADCDRPGGIPVGRPVPDTRIHILDGARTCGTGEPGELCIAGDGLAVGYLGDAELTARKFPEVTVDGQPVRVYRTGDLAHRGADGLIHYLGRADRQVKIRGHRIEPAEVEQQIERLDEVRRCRVVARRDDSGAAQGLLAFCTPTAEGDPLAGLRDRLRPLLVRYQLPEAVLAVPAFPLTANGKLDERALLALASAAEPLRVTEPEPAAEAEAEAAAPADPLLRAVAGHIAAVLDRPAVPLDLPFAELGGGSLQAGRVCSRLGAELGRPVPLSVFLRHPTATALTAWLRRSPTPSAPPSPEPGAPEVPLDPMRIGYLTRHLMDPEDRTAHCLGTWVLTGDLDLDALDAAVRYAHDRHEGLRAAYRPGREPDAVDSGMPAPEPEPLPMAESVEAAVGDLREFLDVPLELTEGDIWRTAVVPVADGRTVFGYVVHHIAFDGWSEAVLAEDLAAGYRARLSAEPATRPPVPSLAEARSIQLARTEHADLAAQRAYLAEELRDLPELLRPGGTDACPDPGEHSGPDPVGRFELDVAPAEAAALSAFAADTGVSRFAVLLARYGQAVAQETGQDDFGVGIPVALRTDARLEHTVGCHIDMLCVRIRGESLGSARDAAVRTGLQLERGLAALDLSISEVVRLVNPPRSARTPLFQQLFVYQDNAVPRLDLPGLHTEFVRQPYLQIPIETQTEVWPTGAGGLRIVVNYQRAAVDQQFARALAKRFADLVRAPHHPPRAEGQLQP